jgi:curved DNA-binding protein CbpA
MNKKSAVQILMVNNDATFEQIKYNYRKLVLEFHPDKNNGQNNEEKFKNITIAYHFLKNQNKLRNFKNRSKRPSDSKSHQKPQYTEKNNRAYNTKEDWSRFTKDFEMNENFWRQYEKSFWEDYEVSTKKKSDKRDFENPFWNVKQKNVSPEPKKNYQNNQSKAFNHNLSVNVDESLCIGCCSCETIAPNVFTVDKLKMVNPKSHAYNQYGASEEKIMDAAETCPTKAIQVDEKKSGRKIFPR